MPKSLIATLPILLAVCWKFINIVRDPNTHPNANDEYNPWNNPDPSRAFILATGFANQRGNAVMLLHANSRRRFVLRAKKSAAVPQISVLQ